MKKICHRCLAFYFIITHFVFISEINAQVPPTQNGKFVTVNGLKLYYEDTGKGMPLVLLHGFTRTSADWQPFIAQFAKSYRVITVDLPGHGRSDYMDTSEVYLHKKAAEYILGLLDQLKIDSANVMGISSGSFITLYMATMRPDLTKKIVLIGGQVYYSVKTRNVITSLESEIKNEWIKGMTEIHGKDKAALLVKQFWNFRKLYGDPLFTPDILASIKAKALIIHGDDDPIAPVTNAWEMFQNISQANLWIVPHGGHVPVAIPVNYDDFIRRSDEFLKGLWEENNMN